MTEFLHATLAFPTILPTALLALVLLYWLLVMLGALELDVLDSVMGLVDGIDGIEGALDASEGLDLDAGTGSTGGLTGVLVALGLTGVPLTISLSLIALFSWCLTFIGMQLVPTVGGLAGIAVLLVAGAGAMAITAVAVRPLRPVFVVHPSLGRQDLVGAWCIVSTSRVDDRFGQAEVIDTDGGSMIVQVRCLDANDLGKGARARILDYVSRDEVFLVSKHAEPAR